MKRKLFLLGAPLALSFILCCCTTEKPSANNVSNQKNTNSSSSNSTITSGTKPSTESFQESISKIFPDPELAKVVANLFHKNINDVVTREELESYKGKLDCPPGELRDLSGIGYLTGITSLTCCKNNVKAIPTEIKNLVNLETLDFGKAYLVESIPAEIGYLQNLKYIRFCLTPITSVPKEIGNLKNLKILLLQANKIQSVPDEIGNLGKLQYLNLSSNTLTSIPKSICNLTDLRTLDLSNNTLQDLPDDLGNLTKLGNFNIFKNNIKALPQSMENMMYLNTINVSDNNELKENYKNFVPKLQSFTLKIQKNSDCNIELPVSFNSSNMKCEFKNGDKELDTYYDYKEISPRYSENKKLTLEKNLFPNEGSYEFRIVQKNTNAKPLYNVFVWQITVE